jgi:hypothetical protein
MARDRLLARGVIAIVAVAAAAVFTGYVTDSRATMRATPLAVAPRVDLATADVSALHAGRRDKQARVALADGDPHHRGLLHKIVFSGQNSRTADKKALARAKEMDGKADPAAIWKETGWRKSKAGSWVYEISDRDAKIVGMPDLSKVRPGKAVAVRLGTLLNHPLLYEAYPDLPNIMVEVHNSPRIKDEEDPDEEYAGATTPAEDGKPAKIEIAGRDCDFLSTLIHEIQHVLEDYEDLDYGPEAGSYDHMIGETRARNTERRLRMGEDLRRSLPPNVTCDTPSHLIQVSP